MLRGIRGIQYVQRHDGGDIPMSHFTLQVTLHDMYNVTLLGRRADHASERIKISPTLPLTDNYTSKIGDIGKKQLVLQTTELDTMSNFTTSTTLW
jgi:hypothetical protein